MLILLIANCVLAVLNLVMLIAIAGTLTKLIGKVEPDNPAETQLMDVQRHMPYDAALLRGDVTPFDDGMTARKSNWDGIPRSS